MVSPNVLSHIDDLCFSAFVSQSRNDPVREILSRCHFDLITSCWFDRCLVLNALSYPISPRTRTLPLFAVSGMMGAARAHVVDVRSGDMPMRLLIAILIPFFLFFTNGRPVAGIGP